MKKFYAFLYIYNEIIALAISLIVSVLIVATLITIILLSGINYSDLVGVVISILITFLFLVLLVFIWAYLADKISNYSYLKIYKDKKFYHQVWLKKQKHL